MQAVTTLFVTMNAARVRVAHHAQKMWANERGDVTSTVIIIAVLVAAAVAAGVVITTYISGQTSKIS